MSWDAYLTDDRGHREGWWNYTHNCSCMIYAVLDDQSVMLPEDTQPCLAHPVDPDTGKLTWYPNGHGTITWWEHLDGMSGPGGAALLDLIVRGLTADPSRFRAMNPENGWGDYDSLVKVLTEMRDAVPEWPATWGASG